ncbi:hypothetical protein J6590_058505 [Homalodisca vitripennis]|nr:hypothetical protein J6590_058505 [Homalodisca vitripennis]
MTFPVTVILKTNNKSEKPDDRFLFSGLRHRPRSMDLELPTVTVHPSSSSLTFPIIIRFPSPIASWFGGPLKSRHPCLRWCSTNIATRQWRSEGRGPGGPDAPPPKF